MSATTATRKTTKPRRPRLSDEEREQRVQALKDKLDDAVLRLMNDPDQWTVFLEQVSMFAAKYSATNQMLIWLQCLERGIEPTMVEPVGDLAAVAKGQKPTYGWALLGRHPKAGEKGLQIWRPVRRRYTDEEYAALTNAEQAKLSRDAKGRLPYHPHVRFNIAYVFDISQTEGDDVELPPAVTVRRRSRVAGAAVPTAQLLTGRDETGRMGDVIALITKRGYTFSFKTAATFADAGWGSANGLTSPEGYVWVREDREEAQQAKTAIHELAHIDCGHMNGYVQAEIHRGQRETEAESVAYIVAGALGMDTGQYSAPYVAGWAEKPETLVQAANTILRVAKAILGALTPGDAAQED